MKISLKIISLLLVLVMLLSLFACEITPPVSNNTETGDTNTGNEGGDGGDGGESESPAFGENYEYITVAEALELAKEHTSSSSAEKYYIIVKIDRIINQKNGEMNVSDSTGSIYIYRSALLSGAALSSEDDLSVGDDAVLYGTLRNYKGTLEMDYASVVEYRGNQGSSGSVGGDVIFPDPDDDITSDPYANISHEDFYRQYKPAVSYKDSYYRSLHGLMSGEIDDQEQAPTIASNRPMSNGLYERNTSYKYSSDGNVYYVVDALGNVVNEIYRGGGYVMLEEVAAYVFAFGEPPANHVSSKNMEPYESIWGIYLRLNHSKFSGDTQKYPYEPALPNISGIGGALTYYEMDVGTTGTDCDPSYDITDYNDGSVITRGAARIVYTRQDLDRDGVIEPDETYLFYTYNHYNDFREYLNYENGWGEMFGNITGGGKLSSKTNYNPTPYVNVSLRDFSARVMPTSVTLIWIPQETLALLNKKA